MIDLQAVDRTDLAGAWRIAEPWLVKACARPGCDLSPSDLLGDLLAGLASLVMIREAGRPVAAGVTQVGRHGDGALSCFVLAVGGAGARAWRHTLWTIEAGAARVGCTRVEFVGRPGWARLLPDYAASACEGGTHFVKHLGAIR